MKTHIYKLISLCCCVLLFASAGAQSKRDIEPVVQTGHQRAINYLEVSVDGNYLASKDFNDKLIIWDIKKEVQVCEVHGVIPNEDIVDFYFDPDDSKLLCICQEWIGDYRNYSIINWKTGAKVGEVKRNYYKRSRKEGIYDIGTVKMEGADNGVITGTDTLTGKVVKRFEGSVFALGSVSVSPNDSLLTVSESYPQVWDMYNMAAIRLPYVSQILKNDASVVFVNEKAFPVRVKDVKPGKKEIRYGFKTYFESQFIDNNRIILGSYGEWITVWDTKGNLLHKIKSPGYPVFSQDFDRASNKIVLGTYDGITTGLIDSEQLTADAGATAKLRFKLMLSVKVIPGTNKYVACGDAGAIIGSLDGTSIPNNFVSRPLVDIDIDAAAKRILLVGEMGYVGLFGINGDELAIYTSDFKMNRVGSCMFLNDTIIVAGSNEGGLQFWNIRDKKPFRVLKPHDGEITAITKSHDGRLFFTSSKDGSAKIWNATDYTEIAKMIATADGEYIVVTPDHYYKTSKGGTDAIHFVDGYDIYEFDQFDLQYNRPDIVLERIGKASPSTIDLYRKAWEKRLKKMKFTEDMISPDFHVPELEITNAGKLSEQTAEQKLRLDIKASDTKYKLNRIQIWINGVPVYGIDGITVASEPGKPVTRAIDLDLVAGANRIDVSCLNDKGAESYRQTVNVNCTAAFPKPNLYLVSAGVSNYTDKQYNLQYADKDARDIAELFAGINTGNYGKVFKKTLTNAEVTRESVKGIKSFFKDAKPNDVIILFYAGHGVLDSNYDYYLASADMNFSVPSQKGIAYEDFEALLDGVKPLNKLMFIDACHSGEIDKDELLAENTMRTSEGDVVFRSAGSSVAVKETVQEVNELMTEVFSDLRRGSGATILSSAGGAEVAVESDRWQNGLFTYTIKNGLTAKLADLNGDGIITTAELNEYVRKTVTTLSQGMQQPTSRLDNRQLNFVLNSK